MPANITVQQYTPSEIIGIFNDILAHQNNQASGKIVCIRGLYLVGNGTAYQGYYYDTLRDEKSPTELPIRISDAQRKELTPGNLVEILGTLGRKITTKSEIKLELNVSRVEVVKEQVIDENEIKRIEYRQRKVSAGFRNVDGLLESLLFNDTRPKIALVIAASSITLKDFEDGIKAARVALDFVEDRVVFTQTKLLCSKLKALDQLGYHAIALVRGGGIDSTTDVDKPEVIETVVGLKTPFISGVGHKDEKIFLRQVADKWTATPQGLGQYFSDMVETVSEKKSKSRAALTEQIKKQFKDQLEAGQKQNKELQEKLTKLTKAQEEAVKKHNEQVQALTKAQTEATKQHKEQVEAIQKQHKEQLEKTNKQNEELQKKLTEITKANETAQKTHAQQLGKLQVQLKAQTEASAKQSKEFNESLTKMQNTNGELNKSLQKLTAQNTQAAKDLNDARERQRQLEKQLEEALSKNKGCSSGCLGMVAAMVSVISIACLLVCLIV
jgi:chemotaxis protein histidine kinase CheA